MSPTSRNSSSGSKITAGKPGFPSDRSISTNCHQVTPAPAEVWRICGHRSRVRRVPHRGGPQQPEVGGEAGPPRSPAASADSRWPGPSSDGWNRLGTCWRCWAARVTGKLAIRLLSLTSRATRADACSSAFAAFPHAASIDGAGRPPQSPSFRQPSSAAEPANPARFAGIGPRGGAEGNPRAGSRQGAFPILAWPGPAGQAFLASRAPAVVPMPDRDQRPPRFWRGVSRCWPAAVCRSRSRLPAWPPQARPRRCPTWLRMPGALAPRLCRPRFAPAGHTCSCERFGLCSSLVAPPGPPGHWCRSHWPGWRSQVKAFRRGGQWGFKLGA